jgi:hypothetical protein
MKCRDKLFLVAALAGRRIDGGAILLPAIFPSLNPGMNDAAAMAPSTESPRSIASA